MNLMNGLKVVCVGLIGVACSIALGQVCDDCQCPSGEYPTYTTVEFEADIDWGECNESNTGSSMSYTATNTAEHTCNGTCPTTMTAEYTYSGLDPCSEAGGDDPDPFSGSTTGVFTATPGHVPATGEKWWMITFLGLVTEGNTTRFECMAFENGGTQFRTSPSNSWISGSQVTGSWDCEQATVTMTDPDSGQSFTLTFRSRGSGCQSIGFEGADGTCGRPDPEPEDEDGEGEEGRGGGGGDDDDEGEEEDDFPDEGGGGGCDSSGNESSSPVAYLTGHKVERATDITVKVPGQDFQVVREYTSNPDYYYTDSNGNYFWNGDNTHVEPGSVGVRWTLNLFRFLTGDVGANTDTLILNGQPMRSVKKFRKIDGQEIFVASGAGNSYIEPDTLSYLGWLDTSSSSDDGTGVKVWKLRNPGGSELVFMRKDGSHGAGPTSLDRTDLQGVILFKTDEYGNTEEYQWITLGTGTNGREIVRLNKVVLKDSSGVEHARIQLDWHGESGTNLLSANTANNLDGEWVYGRLDEIRVERPDAGSTWTTTQRVQYIHFDEIDDITDDSVVGTALWEGDELRYEYDGSPGDLCEVIVSTLVDEDDADADGFYDRITQYRYYCENNGYGSFADQSSEIDSIAGLESSGSEHQLMAVLYPQQIEYYANRVFNAYGALGGDSQAIQTALGINSGEVNAFTSDVYSSSQAFMTAVDAAERLRWVRFSNGLNNFGFSQAILLPNNDWNSLFDLAGKYITYYTSSSGEQGETGRVRTQLVSSGANGCGCGGAGVSIGLGKRFDYLYRRYSHTSSITPPATVNPDFSIVTDGYSSLVVVSHLDQIASSLSYVPYRVHVNDYYWPSSLGVGVIMASDLDSAHSRSGVRRLGRSLCTADPAWGTTQGKEFDPQSDPIDHSEPAWAVTRVYDNDSINPYATQFNNYGKLSAVLSMSAVESSQTGYSAVHGSGVNTLSPIVPQDTDSGRVQTFEYTDGYLTKRSVQDGTGSGAQVEVIAEYNRGGSNDRPDLYAQIQRDAGAGVTETTTMEYGYYDNTNNTNVNTAIVAWTKSSRTPETASQNGPSAMNLPDYSVWSFFDRSGELIWTRDAGGTLTYYEYDLHTGLLTRRTLDADPNDGTIPTSRRINESNFPGITAEGWGLPSRSSYEELTHSYAYDLMGRQIESTDAGGVTSYTRRVVKTSNYVGESDSLIDNGVAVQATMSFPHKLQSGSFDGPISISWQDAAGSSLRESTFECLSSGGNYDPSAGVYGISVEYGRSDSELAVTGATVRSRQWHDLDQALASDGSFYSETIYDELGRTYRVIDPLGSVTQYGTDTVTGYDIMDRSLAVASGERDQSGAISVDLVSETFYDSGNTETQGVGDGLVSLSKIYTGEGTESRITKYWYDYRKRLVGQVNPEAPHQVFGYDTFGRMIEQAAWTDETDFDDGDPSSVPSPSTYSTKRSSYSKTFYNNRGMVYRQIQAIDPTMNPSDQNYPGYLETLTWYDPDGMVAATWNPSGPASKTLYDHLDRPLKSYVTNRKDDGLWGSGSYEEVFDSSGADVDVSDDRVFSQTEYRYIAGGNNGAGQADLVTTRVRVHTGGTAGELDNTNSVSMFQVSNFDDASRVIDSLNYGTNDSTNDKFATGTSAPTTIDTNRSTSPALISSVEFDEIGRQRLKIDPDGKETLTVYDDLSRSIAVVENRTGTFGESNITWSSDNWSVSWGTSPPVDENRVTTFVYDNNSNVIKRTAHLNTGDVQVTEYEYGVTASTGSGVMESRIDAPGLLAQIYYPNESTGLADSSSAYSVSFAYNRLGEMRGKTDQNGIEHAYTRDGAGRVTSDKVGFPSGTDIDDAVAEITTVYDDHGRISGVYSWDGSTTPVELNSVEYEYTKLHQIEAVVQNVDVDGGASDERVEYDYDSAEPTSTGGNYTRLSAVRYPAQSSGSTSSYELDYGVAGSVNDIISRVGGIDVPNWSPPNDELVTYTYVGSNLPVKVRYLSGSILLDSTKAPDGSAPTGEYPAFDRFGRVVWHAWVNNGFTTGPNTGFPNASPLMARRYAYDETTKLRNLDWDGRPGAVLDDRDWEYDYDDLDRLVEASRGQWDNSGSSLTLAANSRQWDLDMLGNWNSVATDLNGTSGFETGDETELRTFNLANELLTREGEPGSGPGGSTPIHSPGYDDAGNLVNNGGGTATELEYVYDAWNRLVRVERPGSFSVLENEYNALGWRIVRRLDTSDSAYDGLDEQRHYYFTPSWQMIEEHVDVNNDGDFDDSGDYKSQQFWGIRYIDDAVAKRIDRDNDGDWEEAGDQYFYLTDAMYSIRALTDSAGYVRERVDYTPYGKAMHRYAGDYNGDGSLNYSDISIYNAQSGKSPGDTGYDPHVDLNGDGTIGSSDVNILMADLNFVGTGGNGVPPEGWLSDNARTSSDGTDNQFGFDGYWFDAAGATDAGSAGVYCVVRNRVYGVGLGRWLQRDPVGYIDGMNLYEYGLSTPIVSRDPSGLSTLMEARHRLQARGVPTTQGNIYGEWYRVEKAMHPWWRWLPRCPCKIECSKDSKSKMKNPNPTFWQNPKRPHPAEEALHPGITWTMRSKPVSRRYNQCTYNSKGVLVTEPPASGTVDFKKPRTFAHVDHDVRPAIWANQLDGGFGIDWWSPQAHQRMKKPIGLHVKRYYEVRPTWHKNCPLNDV